MVRTTSGDELDPKPPCANCIRARGLCRKCASLDRSLLPQLAVNVGWLRMMGEALVEQKKRQSLKPDPKAERIRLRKERKAKARKDREPEHRARNRFARSMRGERHVRVA